MPNTRHRLTPRDANVDVECPSCGEYIRVYTDYGVMQDIVVGCVNGCEKESHFNMDLLAAKAAVEAEHERSRYDAA